MNYGLQLFGIEDATAQNYAGMIASVAQMEYSTTVSADPHQRRIFAKFH